MKFEHIVILIMVGILSTGFFYADKKISNLERLLAESQVDTVTVEIPLSKLDTVIVATSDTVYIEPDTVIIDSNTIVHHYPTATITDEQPLFTGTYTYYAKRDEWTLNYIYKNLGVHLEFPDKFDFRKVIVSTIPDLGKNISIALNDNYQPYKPSKSLDFLIGVGYVPMYDGRATLFLTGGVQFSRTYIGAIRSEYGWGLEIKRVLIRF